MQRFRLNDSGSLAIHFGEGHYEIEETRNKLLKISMNNAIDVYAICFITFDIQIMLKDSVE